MGKCRELGSATKGRWVDFGKACVVHGYSLARHKGNKMRSQAQGSSPLIAKAALREP